MRSDSIYRILATGSVVNRSEEDACHTVQNSVWYKCLTNMLATVTSPRTFTDKVLCFEDVGGGHSVGSDVLVLGCVLISI